jgi:hypothetical protein
MIDIKALKQALEVIETEKRIPRQKVLEAVEASLAAAYKKEYAGKDISGRTKDSPKNLGKE